MTENLPSNPPQFHAPTGRRGEAGPPNLSAHPTAADQPTTEPSEEWRTDLIEAMYDALDRHGPTDLGYDDTRALAVRLADTALGAAPAPEPAVDTETEVQWGLRLPDGEDVLMVSEERARWRAETFLRPLLRRTVTTTPWEEA